MVRSYRRIFQLGHGLMVSWAVFGAIALTSQHPWIVLIEGQAQSFLLRLRGPVPPPEEIVIVGIDEYSLTQGDLYQAEPDRYPFLEPLAIWPWQRQAYAQAIEQLMAAGAKAVALDVLLVDPSGYGPDDDAALEATLARWGNRVALAAAYDVSSSDFGLFTNLLQPVYSSQTQVGLINLEVDADGKHRAFPDRGIETLRQTHQFSDNLPSLAGATLAAANYPSPERQSQQLFFYGPAGSFPVVSFVQLLDPINWPLIANQFEGKIVLIGPMATSFQDRKRTPIDDAMPGVEIHAHALAVLMEDRVVNVAIANPLAQGLLTAIAIGAIGLGLGYRFTQPVPRLVGFLGAIVAWGAIAYLLMVHGDRLMPVAIPVACLGMGGVTYIATGAVSNRLEEQRLRRTLERYVAPSVAQEILNQPEDFTSLTVGQKFQAAVLFSDIRGFSRISYQLGAIETVSLLNSYLDVMVDAILEHRGTIDKFIGDAVMAEFGAPKSLGPEQDALGAVSAALAMRKALATLRISLKEKGLPPLYNGIGISYGELVVGNVGSVLRLEYTAIGDTVNVASRIEGLTKMVGTDILITQPCYDLVKEHIIAVDQGTHFLAGREHEAVQVYGVVSLKGKSDELYHQVQKDLGHHLDQFPRATKS
ncbi:MULTISPECIES: adenylate/guanylate cyclase domain-containing protein [Cyanophyceae]|uniref:CHASE2 domain-containing protein n=1 Tax=Cyanophyceae TaxID=3028117 RepID=UPI0016890F6A|nr:MULTISPECIES: adenylate/guanylate cyclase domain-containing protein [unclassified Phormidium]MBD1917357.1 adenylate/guanylate cyclase domain-containing protein [Phormidium sp. FACHB-77]MBD2032281.1 adenylate/guanylate cyclase domain-containing protein [Phormidium sp. FACHB-322]MBD2053318.1 adenylate/guanylate cyclase domain-containing protein [Leptolyngbya sp. FACHB-60]